MRVTTYTSGQITNAQLRHNYDVPKAKTNQVSRYTSRVKTDAVLHFSSCLSLSLSYTHSRALSISHSLVLFLFLRPLVSSSSDVSSDDKVL